MQAAVIGADPTNYKSQMNLLQPGDTLQLAPGTYVRLYLENRNGTPDAWITIAGNVDRLFWATKSPKRPTVLGSLSRFGTRH